MGKARGSGVCLDVVIKYDYSCVMHAAWILVTGRGGVLSFLHGDCRETVCARQASWYLAVQVHNAPAKKNKGIKITDVGEVVSHNTFIIKS